MEIGRHGVCVQPKISLLSIFGTAATSMERRRGRSQQVEWQDWRRCAIGGGWENKRNVELEIAASVRGVRFGASLG